MNEPLECPSADVLEQFLRGELDPARQERVSGHLDQCPACARTVEAASTRTYSLHAVSPNSPTVPAGKEAPTVAVSLGGDDEDASPLELLDPPLNEKAIGRIGKYDVFDVLGRGGYGIVFRGFDEQLRRPIAIKVLGKYLASSEQARRRFIREARAAAIINHPSVVTIHAVEEHRGMPFLVMEFITGGSLRDRIRDGPKLGPVDLVRVAAQIAAGLAAAHAQGVIHRDIKPGNVMLENGIERLKITDFGLARVALDNVDLTSRAMAVGTPAYMAPEQVAGGEVDGRTDLFALGCVIYAMVTGHSPFQGRSALEIARRVHDDHPPPLHEIDKSVPLFLSDIAEKLLQKDPNQRFQSAAEVASILNSHLTILNQTPTDELPRALNRPLTTTPPTPRRSIGRLAAASLALAALLLVAWLGWQRWRADDSPDAAAPVRGQVPVAAVTSAASPAPSAARLAHVTVARQGSGDCSTIGQALARVAPGGVIEILDDSVYEESLLIAPDNRYRDLKIFANHGAALQSDGDDSLLTIRGVSGLAVHGLGFIARQEQLAIVLEGNCEGTSLENLVIQRTPNHSYPGEFWAAVHVRPGATGTQVRPIAIRGVRIDDTTVGIVLGMRSGINPPQWVTVEDCRISGAPRGSLLVLFSGVKHVGVQRTIFRGGLNAVEIVTQGGAPLEDVRIAHNTLHGCRNWIQWETAASNGAEHDIAFQANLLLDVGGPEMRKPEGARTFVPWWSTSELPWFSDNVWRSSPQTNRENAGRVARVADQPLVASEDPQDPNYLKPSMEQLRSLVGDAAPLPGHYHPDQP